MTGKEVKAIINKYGIKQTFIADKMGVIPQTLASYLSTSDIKTGVLQRIADAMGKDITIFFTNPTENS